MQKNKPTETTEQDRLRLLFKQAQSASIAAAVGAIACTLVIYREQPGAAPLIWLAVLMAATALRFVLYHRFFATDIQHHPQQYWLRRHAATAVLVGLSWGALPLVVNADSPAYIHELATLVPGFVVMAAITSYGIYPPQFLVLLCSTGLTTIATSVYAEGWAGVTVAILFAVFAPILALTAKRYGESLAQSIEARSQAAELVQELTATNSDLMHQNALLEQQRDLIEQEEALAQHVFRQLILGGDHRLPGVHTWNQSMGTLSGDLTQTARGPAGQAYVFLGDFTGHGLPAALGALPASSVFLAMAGKGLPVDVIARELNNKLRQLLPIGYFCCAVLLELSADRRSIHVWNGGLPPVLIKRRSQPGYEKIASHSLPLGVVGNDEFESTAKRHHLHAGDLLYAYSDGLTEAENFDGEMWGIDRLEAFLQRPDLPTPRLPSLIDTVLEHVNLAPPSDDISVVEIEATPKVASRADAA